MTARGSLIALLALATACAPGDKTSDTDAAGGGGIVDSGDTGSPSIPPGVDTDDIVTGDEAFASACDNLSVTCLVKDGQNLGYLQGVVDGNVTLTANASWILRGGVFFGNGEDLNVTVTIEPGTTIFGDSATDGLMVINRGSKIIAEGTKDAPIVFTSAKAAGSRGASDWGGLILNGYAKNNTCDDANDDGTVDATELKGCDLNGEGGTGVFGGDDDADDSGILKYVRVEFAGTLISSTQEVNGIAFQGVGSGTTVDYLHAHQVADDGVEFYGGAVNAKHVMVTGAGDDGVDWTDGWTGKLQYVFVQQYAGTSNRMIEADNSEDDNAILPRSAPTLQNVTLHGEPMTDRSEKEAVILRRGTGAKIDRMLIATPAAQCIRLDSGETYKNAWDAGNSMFTGNLAITNSLITCTDDSTGFKDASGQPFTAAAWYDNAGWNNQQVADPKVADASKHDSPANAIPQSGSPLLGLTAGKVDGADPFFEETTYIGAFAEGDTWWDWSSFEKN